MIEVKNLTKSYSAHQIFENFNCIINESEMVAIKGASGSGKTTLLNILGLLDTNFQGHIVIDGFDITNFNKRKREKFIRNNISYLFQNYALIEDETIEYNLMLALEYKKINKADKINLIKTTLSKVGINKELNEKIFNLSGGEQQRISLARTILKPSRIILADEPTGNLDNQNRNDVIKILKELRKEGKMVIIVTHDDIVAKECDKIIEI